MDNGLIENITNNISQSKNYKGIYKPAIQRIVKDLSTKYPAAQLEKNTKKKLHQIWGAFLINPKYEKLYEDFTKNLQDGIEIKECIKPLLKQQSSTFERLEYIDEFYKRIFEITGIPKTIIEPACGLNPLTYFWMGNDIEYTGYDIDEVSINFMNEIFKTAGLDQKVKVKPGDIFLEPAIICDLTFLFKIVPLIEQQQKNTTLDFLRNVKSKHIAISFPSQSISGKKTGMRDFYSELFTKQVSEEKWKIEKLIFAKETVFVVTK